MRTSAVQVGVSFHLGLQVALAAQHLLQPAHTVNNMTKQVLHMGCSRIFVQVHGL